MGKRKGEMPNMLKPQTVRTRKHAIAQRHMRRIHNLDELQAEAIREKREAESKLRRQCPHANVIHFDDPAGDCAGFYECSDCGGRVEGPARRGK